MILPLNNDIDVVTLGYKLKNREPSFFPLNLQLDSAQPRPERRAAA